MSPEQAADIGRVSTQRMLQVGPLNQEELRHLTRHLIMFLTVNPGINWEVFLSAVVMARRDHAAGIEAMWPPVEAFAPRQ